MTRIFVDTVGFLALWDERDQWHAAAVSAFDKVRSLHGELVSSPFVFLELGNAAARRPYRDLVTEFKMAMETDRTLISASNDEVSEAWNRYRARFANGAGIVDQTSFLLMERLGIRSVITNDEHFRAAGFDTLM